MIIIRSLLYGLKFQKESQRKPVFHSIHMKTIVRSPLKHSFFEALRNLSPTAQNNFGLRLQTLKPQVCEASGLRACCCGPWNPELQILHFLFARFTRHVGPPRVLILVPYTKHM